MGKMDGILWFWQAQIFKQSAPNANKAQGMQAGLTSPTTTTDP